MVWMDEKTQPHTDNTAYSCRPIPLFGSDTANGTAARSPHTGAAPRTVTSQAAHRAAAVVSVAAQDSRAGRPLGLQGRGDGGGGGPEADAVASRRWGRPYYRALQQPATTPHQFPDSRVGARSRTSTGCGAKVPGTSDNKGWVSSLRGADDTGRTRAHAHASLDQEKAATASSLTGARKYMSPAT